MTFAQWMPNGSKLCGSRIARSATHADCLTLSPKSQDRQHSLREPAEVSQAVAERDPARHVVSPRASAQSQALIRQKRLKRGGILNTVGTKFGLVCQTKPADLQALP